MSSGQDGKESAEDAFIAELYLRLEERAAAKYSDSYDAAAASARYRAWLSSRTLTPARELVTAAYTRPQDSQSSGVRGPVKSGMSTGGSR